MGNCCAPSEEKLRGYANMFTNSIFNKYDNGRKGYLSDEEQAAWCRDNAPIMAQKG